MIFEQEAAESTGRECRLSPHRVKGLPTLPVSSSSFGGHMDMQSVGAKKGCAQCRDCGFIPVVNAGGEEYCSRKWTDCGTLARVNTVNRRRMRVVYSGQVQGVGFRYTVKSVATGFDVTGSVRNLPGGGVELVAEGAKDELEAFRQAIRESGLDHFIRDEVISWAEPRSEFRGFEIVR